MIAWLLTIAVLVAAVFAAFMRSLLPEPSAEPQVLPLARPASAPRAAAAFVTEAWHESDIHRFARIAREYAGDTSGVLTARAARLAQAPIPYLDVDWRDATDSFRIICGIEVA